MSEAGACGTAAVISTVSEIDDLDTGEQFVISTDGKVGPVSQKLYDTLRGIQYGEVADEHGWCEIIN